MKCQPFFNLLKSDAFFQYTPINLKLKKLFFYIVLKILNRMKVYSKKVLQPLFRKIFDKGFLTEKVKLFKKVFSS